MKLSIFKILGYLCRVCDKHGGEEGCVGVLDLDEPGRVGHLLPVELDVDPVPPGVVGDEVRLKD